MRDTTYKPGYLAASGQIFTGKCVLANMLIGTDSINNPTITVYDGTDNTGNEIIPTAEYDASLLGLNGLVSAQKEVTTGIYVEIACAGTVEVVIDYKDRALWGVF